jgi:hypothetical protein
MTHPLQALPLPAEVAPNFTGRGCAVLGGGPGLLGVNILEIRRRLRTIGCNVAARFSPDITVAYDLRAIRLLENRGWTESPLRLTTWKHRGGRFRSQWYYPEDNPAPWSLSLEQGIGRAGGCGLFAYNLAWLLGAEPIYLLGFDLAWSGTRGERVSHEHQEYPWGADEGILRDFLQAFALVPGTARERTVAVEPTRLAEIGYQTITAEAMNDLVGSRC